MWRIQLRAVDHSDCQSMRNVASYDSRRELQDTLSARSSNAHCGLGAFPRPHLSESRNGKYKAICSRLDCTRCYESQSCVVYTLDDTMFLSIEWASSHTLAGRCPLRMVLVPRMWVRIAKMKNLSRVFILMMRKSSGGAH